MTIDMHGREVSETKSLEKVTGMLIAVVDGMGGGLGGQLIAGLTAELGAKAEIIAVGTNALATSNMIRAGASRGAAGENAVVFSLRRADIVAGPIGIVVPNAMMGEITPPNRRGGCEF